MRTRVLTIFNVANRILDSIDTNSWFESLDSTPEQSIVVSSIRRYLVIAPQPLSSWVLTMLIVVLAFNLIGGALSDAIRYSRR